jgi:hypothetical protein
MIMIAKIKRRTNMAVLSPPAVSTPHGSGEDYQRANHDHNNCKLKELSEVHSHARYRTSALSQSPMILARCSRSWGQVLGKQ